VQTVTTNIWAKVCYVSKEQKDMQKDLLRSCFENFDNTNNYFVIKGKKIENVKVKYSFPNITLPELSITIQSEHTFNDLESIELVIGDCDGSDSFNFKLALFSVKCEWNG
jgi:hypothetical protein